jgi:hypothetical protein
MSTHINMKNGVYLTEYSMNPLLATPAITGAQPVDQDVEEKTEKNEPQNQELSAVPEIGRDTEDIRYLGQSADRVLMG